MTARKPRQVAAQNVYGERRRHQERTHPEAPVLMHSSPVRAGIGLVPVATVAFRVVFVSGHLFSIFQEYSGQRTGRVGLDTIIRIDASTPQRFDVASPRVLSKITACEGCSIVNSNDAATGRTRDWVSTGFGIDRAFSEGRFSVLPTLPS